MDLSRKWIDSTSGPGFTPPVSAHIKANILAAWPETLSATMVLGWAGCVLAWKPSGNFNLVLAPCTLGGSIAIKIVTIFFDGASGLRTGAETEKRLEFGGLLDALPWTRLY